MDCLGVLIEKAKNGESDAIAAIVNQFERAAIVTAWTILGDFHQAEDVAQESFVVALRQLADLNSSNAFASWFLKCVRRNATAYRKRFRNRAFVPLPISVPDRPCWQQEFLEILPALRSLPEREREVVELRYLSGFSVSQVAEATGRPIGTITKQLSRAIDRLQKLEKDR